jgi:hypothetical protein
VPLFCLHFLLLLTARALARGVGRAANLVRDTTRIRIGRGVAPALRTALRVLTLNAPLLETAVVAIYAHEEFTHRFHTTTKGRRYHKCFDFSWQGKTYMCGKRPGRFLRESASAFDYFEVWVSGNTDEFLLLFRGIRQAVLRITRVVLAGVSANVMPAVVVPVSEVVLALGRVVSHPLPLAQAFAVTGSCHT